jgi:predicted PurR-regulated permease PerM
MAASPPRGRLPVLTSGLLGRATVRALQVLIIFCALWALSVVAAQISIVVVPLAVALLLAALLAPMAGWLRRHRWPRALAALVALLAGLVVVGGLVTFIAVSVASDWEELGARLTQGIDQTHGWLVHGPLHLDDRQLGQVFDQLRSWLDSHRDVLASTALNTVTAVGEAAAGVLLALFMLIVFLYDGEGVWRHVVALWPSRTAGRMDRAGRAAFDALVRFVRTTGLVALIDAVAIGIGLALLRVPLVVPLAALVFLGAFVPYVGAFASGTAAVAMGLLAGGPVTALLVLAVVVGVQQLEGNVLHPLLTGNFVRLHPLVVVVVVAIGGAEAGIVGALLAVPVTACVHAALTAVRNPSPSPAPESEPE